MLTFLTVKSYSGRIFQPTMALVATWENVRSHQDTNNFGLVSLHLDTFKYIKWLPKIT